MTIAFPHILLINPNSSRATSNMMLSIARRAAGNRIAVAIATAMRSPSMIVTSQELEDSVGEVIEIGSAHTNLCVGIIVSAFGDPGADILKQRVAIPVVGICEASMLAASRGGRKFGVATVTPDLAEPITACARRLGLSHLYTGIRCSADDPLMLTRDTRSLEGALAAKVHECIACDEAEAVIIGGGPLGEAAENLQPQFPTPILAPIPCAVEQLLEAIQISKSMIS